MIIEQIKKIVDNLDKTEISDISLLNTLESVIVIFLDLWIDKYTKKEICEAILILINETDYNKFYKKYLSYIFFLKYISDDQIINLQNIISETFFKEIHLIQSEIIQNQIYDLINKILNFKINDFYLILNQWKSNILDSSKNIEIFKCFTNLLFYIYSKSFNHLNHYYLKYFNEIFNIYSQIYDNQSDLFLNHIFISKLEYSQNIMFPFMIKHINLVDQKITNKFIQNILIKLENILNLKIFVFTLRIPNFIQLIIDSNYYFEKDVTKLILYQGIIHHEYEIRKSTKFILEKIYTCIFYKKYSNIYTSEQKQIYFNYLNSFLCILDCYENFSIHLLKNNWDQFQNLMIHLQFTNQEWWINCLIEKGLNHENLNVRKYVAFNTMKFLIQNLDKSFPNWINKNTFFQIYLKYILSSLNNKISFQIEELFIHFIYSIINKKNDWILEYLIFIKDHVKVFTSLRIMIYPLRIGFNSFLNQFNSIHIYKQNHIPNINYSNNHHFKIKSKNHDKTQIYTFEYQQNNEIILLSKDYFIQLLNISIPLIKYVPIILRKNLYLYWLEIMINYFNNNEFQQNDLFNKIIIFLGIIPEYIYIDPNINHIIKLYFSKNKYKFDNYITSIDLSIQTNQWFELFQYGIGFGRFKQIFQISSNIHSIINNHIIFISSYYNSEVYSINNLLNNQLSNLYNKLQILFQKSQGFDSMDLDILWFEINYISLLNYNSNQNQLLIQLWNWCIQHILQINILFQKIKQDIYLLISYIMIIKCIIHLKKFMNFSSNQQIIKFISNLLILDNQIILKYLMNNQHIQNWDKIRRKNSKYNIIDIHSINNDKYSIISSCNISIGYPNNYSNHKISQNYINRLIKLFPSNYRDLFITLSQLKFQLINICILDKNIDLFKFQLNEKIEFFQLFNKENDIQIKSINGSYINYFQQLFNLLLIELENSDFENLYIWELIENILIIIANNYNNFDINIISNWLKDLFNLIIKNTNELIENGIYNNYLIIKFNDILTNKNFIDLFKNFNMIENIINYYYNQILHNNGNIRLFIFPLLNLINEYIKKCDNYLFIYILEDLQDKMNDFRINTIILIANIILELLIFEEKGLIDCTITRFQNIEKKNLEFEEYFNLYERCKIYEDYNSFIRHSVIIYIYNLFEDSNKNKDMNKNYIQFIYIIIILITKRLDNFIPRIIDKEINLNDINILEICKYKYLEICLKEELNNNYKEVKKFPPLPNSIYHKILIHLWQSLCCFFDIMKIKNKLFTDYIIEFYFRHLNYLYNPDIRQYIDLFGSNLVKLYPKICIKFLKKGLLNNINNHTQVLYSFLCISSYLIYSLKEKIPFPCNKDIIFNNNIIDNDLFDYNEMNWIKIEKDILEEYISFINIFISYSSSNSSLLRNIVLFTIYDFYKDDYIKYLIDNKDNLNNKLNNNLNIIFEEAFNIKDFDIIIDLLKRSELYLDIFENKILRNSFILNIMILEESSNIRSLLRNIINNIDIIKMLNNLDKFWIFWNPLKYCSIEYIIPNDNLMEFSDQRMSQDFFNNCKSFDEILDKIQDNKELDNNDIEESLIAFQDNCDEFRLNSHLILGDLRPSWSLYYLLKKIICREMSNYYYESEDLKKNNEIFKEQILTKFSNYQVKFEPLNENRSIIEKPVPKRVEISALDRTDLIVLASLVDKIPNLAGLTRTCEVFRVKELLLNTKKVLNDPLFKQISVTAEKWVPINELPYEEIQDYILRKRMEGYKVFALEQTSSSVLLNEFTFPKKSIFILGKEKEGVPSDLVSIVDKCIEIPQYGMIRSLNVHVSASILIYEYTKQIMQGN